MYGFPLDGLKIVIVHVAATQQDIVFVATVKILGCFKQLGDLVILTGALAQPSGVNASLAEVVNNAVLQLPSVLGVLPSVSIPMTIDTGVELLFSHVDPFEKSIQAPRFMMIVLSR